MSEILYTTNGMNVFDNNAPGIIPKVLSNSSPINGIDASQYPKYDPDTGALKFIPENVFYGDYLRNESNRSDVRASIPTSGMDQFTDQPITSSSNSVNNSVSQARELFKQRRRNSNCVPNSSNKENYCGCTVNKINTPAFRIILIIIFVIILAFFIYKLVKSKQNNNGYIPITGGKQVKSKLRFKNFF